MDVDDEDFNLIQPSLIQQLRKILDEYPDDGQILKVFHFQLLTFSLFYIFLITAMSMDFKRTNIVPIGNVLKSSSLPFEKSYNASFKWKN